MAFDDYNPVDAKMTSPMVPVVRTESNAERPDRFSVQCRDVSLVPHTLPEHPVAKEKKKSRHFIRGIH